MSAGEVHSYNRGSFPSGHGQRTIAGLLTAGSRASVTVNRIIQDETTSKNMSFVEGNGSRKVCWLGF
jgi:hypothetical protein